MAGQGGGGGRVIFWIALIGFLGLAVGALIGGYFGYRGSNLKEAARIVEVTREVEVERPVEVTRLITETKVIEVTRIVEIVRELPMVDSFADQANGAAAPETVGSIIIGVLNHDGRFSTGTHTVALYPITLLNDAGELKPDRDGELLIPVNEETGFAEAYGLAAGTYAVCLKSLLHTATVGEIEIVAGEVTRADLHWPAGTSIIRVECVL